MKNLILLSLLTLSACKAKASSISIPSTVPCPTCVTDSAPSPLLWKSTQTHTAPVTISESSLDAPALDATANDGTSFYTVDLAGPGGIMSASADQDAAAITLNSYNPGASRGSLILFRAFSGTQASPGATVLNQTSGLVFRGRTSSGNTAARAVFDMGAAENWTTSANGTFFAWQTTANGSTTTSEKMRLSGDGKLGIGTTSPGTRLHVTSGTVTIDGAGSGLNVTNDVTVGGNVNAGWERVSSSCGTGVTSCFVSCSAGKVLLGGGCFTDQPLLKSYPSSSTRWDCTAQNNSVISFDAYAICARMGP